MEKQPFIQDFQQKLLELFRASPAADLERNIKALLGQTFNKLELVTRDEFEVQVELLRVLRARVDALEARLSAASSGVSSSPSSASAGSATAASAAVPGAGTGSSAAGFPGTDPGASAPR